MWGRPRDLGLLYVIAQAISIQIESLVHHNLKHKTKLQSMIKIKNAFEKESGWKVGWNLASLMEEWDHDVVGFEVGGLYDYSEQHCKSWNNYF